METHWTFFLFLAVAVWYSEAAVLGIDLGSESLKMAVVRAGVGLEIVLNEQTKRSTANCIGFRPDERFFGADALQLNTRFPAGMISYVSQWVGVPFEEVKRKCDALLFPFEIYPSERGTAVFAVTKDERYSAEELMGMLFSYIKKLADKHGEASFTDCVLSIPASFSLRQRQALVDTASLGGLRVLDMMHHSASAALQYGVAKRGFSEVTNVAVLDIGSGHLEVGIVTYFPAANLTKNATKEQKENALGRLKHLSVASDDFNGGRFYDALIARHLAEEYKVKTGNDALANPKSVAKLMRSAKRAKEVLSSLKEARVAVEGIWEDVDFHTKLSRETFAKLVEPLVARAVKTIEEAVAKAGITMESLDSIELMGGGTRVPILQERLATAFEGRVLGRTLNTDESCAMGTAFQAARVSGAFRVRGFEVDQTTHVNISFALSPTEKIISPATRPLFVGTGVPHTMVVTAFRPDDFNATLFIQGADSEDKKPLSTYELQGVAEALDSLGLHGTKKNICSEVDDGSKDDIRCPSGMTVTNIVFASYGVAGGFCGNWSVGKCHSEKSVDVISSLCLGQTNCTLAPDNEQFGGNPCEGTDKSLAVEVTCSAPAHPNTTFAVNLNFTMQHSGLVTLSSAEAVLFEVNDVVKRVRRAQAKATETSNASESNVTEDADADDAGTAETSKTDSVQDTEASNATNATVNTTANATEVQLFDRINSTRTTVLTKSLTALSHHLFAPAPMSSEDIRNATSMMRRLQRREEDLLALASAKNALATFVLDIKYDKFFDDKELKEHYNETEGEAVRTMMGAVEEWLDEVDYAEPPATKGNFTRKRKELQALTEPIVKRKTDAVYAKMMKDLEATYNSTDFNSTAIPETPSKKSKKKRSKKPKSTYKQKEDGKSDDNKSDTKDEL